MNLYTTSRRWHLSATQTRRHTRTHKWKATAEVKVGIAQERGMREMVVVPHATTMTIIHDGRARKEKRDGKTLIEGDGAMVQLLRLLQHGARCTKQQHCLFVWARTANHTKSTSCFFSTLLGHRNTHPAPSSATYTLPLALILHTNRSMR